MKTRKFYPRQVAKILAGRKPEEMTAGEKTALSFFIMKGRKYGVAVSVLPIANASDLMTANSEFIAGSILSMKGSRVVVKYATK